MRVSLKVKRKELNPEIEVLRLIEYRKCDVVSKEDIYEAFINGFSDYVINISLPMNDFFERFFGPEGNSLEHSIIAYDGKKPVGLNLGGIKIYEGIKTLRCGTLCIHPDYRGTEVSKVLFDHHKSIAIDSDCKQMFLEVIVGNDRAINFYKRRGYEKVYDLWYYTHNNPEMIRGRVPEGILIERLDFYDLRIFEDPIKDVHVNWQNDFDYISHMDNNISYGVYYSSRLIGGLCINPLGKIYFLWIDHEFRGRGLGRGLVRFAVKELTIEKLHISFPNNASLFGFVKHLGFDRDSISQHEMYLTL